jgi:hypothetical protein
MELESNEESKRSNRSRIPEDNGKIKVQLSLGLTKYQAMKTYPMLK